MKIKTPFQNSVRYGTQVIDVEPSSNTKRKMTFSHPLIFHIMGSSDLAAGGEKRREEIVIKYRRRV